MSPLFFLYNYPFIFLALSIILSSVFPHLLSYPPTHPRTRKKKTYLFSQVLSEPLAKMRNGRMSPDQGGGDLDLEGVLELLA